MLTNKLLHNTKQQPLGATAAKKVVTPGQQLLVGFFVITLALGLIFSFTNAVIALVIALTVLYFSDLLFQFYLVFRSFVKDPEIKVSPPELTEPRDWPKYTVFCPMYKEPEVLESFLHAMEALSYPKDKLQILLLLEADDLATQQAVARFSLPEHFTVVIIPDSLPKTKPKALNQGLALATGEYSVIFDAEDKPEPDQLKKAVLAFNKLPDSVVCVQAKLNFYNPSQNVLTRLFTLEYSLWFDLVLTGLQSINGPIPLGGTSNHFKTKVLQELGGWDPYNVTEDCDLGMRLLRAGYRTALVDSTTYEEANSRVRNWYRQRSRWIKGYMQTYLVHMRGFGKGFGLKNWLLFQLVVGGKILSFFVNPLLWFITILYFAFRPAFGPTIEQFFPPLVLYVGVFSLAFGNFLYFYYYMMGAAKRGFYNHIKYAFLVPFYWLGMSAASLKALYELIVKPFYWQKTAHGLHLQNRVQGGGSRDRELVAGRDVGPGSGRAARVFPQNQVVHLKPAPAYSMAAGSAGETNVTVKPRTLFNTKLLFSSGGILVFSLLVANALHFAFNGYLGRMLPAEQFSTLALFSTLGYLLSIPFGSLAGTINRQSAYFYGKKQSSLSLLLAKKSAWYAAGIALLAVALTSLVLPVLASFFNTPAVLLLVFLAVLLPVGVIASVWRGYLQGTFYFKVLAALVVLEGVLKLGLAVVLEQAGLGEYASLAMPFSLAVVALLAFLIVVAVAKGVNAPKEALSGRAADLAFPAKFFAASLISGLASAAFLSVDVLAAKHYLAAEQAGEYGLLSLVGKMVFFFGTLLNVFLVTFVAKDLGQGKPAIKTFNKLFAGAFVLTFSALLGLLLFGSWLVPLLLGPNAGAILQYLPVYGCGIALFTLSTVIVGYHVTLKHYRFAALQLVFALLLSVGISFNHSSTGDIAAMVALAGLGAFVFSAALHTFETYGRFALRAVVDLLNVLVPLPQPANTAGKRILIFNWRDTKHAFAGGAEIYVHELAKRWVQAGNQVTLFCGNDGNSLPNELTDGVHIVRRGGFYLVYFWAFVYYLTKFRGKYDVIIDCENGIPFFTPLYVKEPVYCLLHHVHQDVFRKYLSKPLALFASALEAKCMPWVYRNTKFITISNSSKADMLELELGLAGIEIVHPGANLEALRPGKKSAVPLVLYLGRLKAYKSVDVLIKAFKKVLSVNPKAKLVIAGDGEELPKLSKLAQDLGLGGAVEFLGKVEEDFKVSLLQKAWVFVNPSMMEGWGITTIEANACGTPVVASNVPGLRDSVNNPHTGYLVPYGDVEKMAEKITYLLENEEHRRFMESEAIHWAKQFSWDISAQKSLTIIYGS